MLTDLLQKIKVFFKENQKDLFLAALVFLVSAASFGLGRLSAIWPTEEPLVIEEPKEEIQTAKAGMTNEPSQPSPSSFGLSSPADAYVASKNGSSYHLPSCPGAKQIKTENKIWFKTKTEAQAAGYKPAGNCPGLQQ